MVDFLRELVSGKKKRFTHEGFNLDLSYITERVIAMAFPSTGFESMYRNDISDVAKLLNQNHGFNYHVINLSGRPYGYEKFGNRVTDYAWEDHHSPAMDILFAACKQIHEYLQKDVKNVVVVHCLAGKGRTGTLISCYLLYSGRFETTQEALYYYKKRRFQNGGGVTQPSQIRYVKYFGEVFHGHIQRHFVYSPLVVRLEKLVIHGTPRISSGYFRPYVEIYSVRDKVLAYTNKNSNNLKKYPTDEDYEDTKIEIPLPNITNLIMAGDILIKVHHMATLGTNLAFRFGFSTAFLEKEDGNTQTVMEFPLSELDPDKRKDDERFPLNFKVELHMSIIPLPPRLKDPLYHTILNQLKREEPHWEHIYKILKDYRIPSNLESSISLFGDPSKDNVNELLNLNQNRLSAPPNLAQRRDSQESSSESNNSSENEGDDGFNPSNTGRPRFQGLPKNNTNSIQRFSLQHLETNFAFQNPPLIHTKSIGEMESSSNKITTTDNIKEEETPTRTERVEIAMTQIEAPVKEEEEEITEVNDAPVKEEIAEVNVIPGIEITQASQEN